MKTINASVISRLFTTPVTFTEALGTNSLGDSLGDKTQTFNCYLYEKNTLVVNAEGKEVVSSSQLYMKGSDIELITPENKVTYGDFSQLPIISKEVFYAEASTSFIGVVYLP
ncbi:MAG: hypothetical protein R3Y58_01835 [Eubacteriales bacterium]